MCFAFIINHCIKVIVRHLSLQPPVVIVRFLVAISDVGLVYSVYFVYMNLNIKSPLVQCVSITDSATVSLSLYVCV